MSVTVTIPVRAFRAVAPAMASNDIRFYLNGVYIETNGAETRIVATDGHRLHCVRLDDDSALIDWPVSVIIPATLVKAIVKAKSPRYVSEPTVNITLDGGRIGVTLPDGTSISGAAIDGKFPDYRRVIPDTPATGEPAAYNSDYVSAAIAGAQAWMNSKTLLRYPKTNGAAPAMLDIDRYLAIIMPLRSEFLTDHAPSIWRDELQRPQQPVQIVEVTA